jgi:hypothetical protein
VGGAAQVTGQLPFSPVVLAAGEACGALADGGLSTLGQGSGNSRRKSATQERRREIPGTQAPEFTEGLDGPERVRTIPWDSSQKIGKTLLQPERSEDHYTAPSAVRTGVRGRSPSG